MKKIGLISILIIILDRIIKVFINNNFKLNVSNKVIDNFFYITNCHNKGAAFSILNGNVLFLIIITILALFIILKFIKSRKNIKKLEIVSYGFLIGGIIGNLIDRVFLGYVIDYLDFIIFGYDFAVFNLADMCIIAGVALFLFSDWGSNNDRQINSK